MSRPDLLLGVDAGQTVTKAGVYDAAGRELGTGRARVSLSTPAPRHVERDMDEVWTATAAAIRTALQAAGAPPSQVAAVGIAGHNDGAYLLDADLRPVRPAITAMDTRAAPIAARWRAGPIGPRALALTGQEPYAGSPAALLAWLAGHEPAAIARTRWALFCKDWLRLRLTGGPVVTDPTEASASFTDVRTQAYSPAALDLFGLAALADRLPPIRSSTAVVARVAPDGAAATGLAAGTPVVTGAHDVDAVALGCGVCEPGLLSLVAGTFSINQVVSATPTTGAGWQARSFVTAGRWLAMATSPSSAGVVDWFLRLVGRPVDDAGYAALAAAAAESLDGPSELVFCPFVFGSPTGRDTGGALVGLRGWHDRGHLARALLEGTVLAHRMHVERLATAFPLGSVARLSGGAARSAVWTQLFADGLGRAVEVPAGAETGTRGAALLAGVGVGVYPSLAAAAATVAVDRRHDPDPARRAVLDAAYADFVATAATLPSPADRGR